MSSSERDLIRAELLGAPLIVLILLLAFEPPRPGGPTRCGGQRPPGGDHPDPLSRATWALALLAVAGPTVVTDHLLLFDDAVTTLPLADRDALAASSGRSAPGGTAVGYPALSWKASERCPRSPHCCSRTTSPTTRGSNQCESSPRTCSAPMAEHGPGAWTTCGPGAATTRLDRRQLTKRVPSIGYEGRSGAHTE